MVGRTYDGNADGSQTPHRFIRNMNYGVRPFRTVVTATASPTVLEKSGTGQANVKVGDESRSVVGVRSFFNVVTRTGTGLRLWHEGGERLFDRFAHLLL